MHRIIPAILAIGVATAGGAWAQTAPPGSASGGATGTVPGTSLSNPGAAAPGGMDRTGTAGRAGADPGVGTGPSTSPAPAAVTTTAAPSRTTEAPVAGSNSFTEGQARSRIEDRGYAQVTELRKDDQGIWRGKAIREGRAVNVALDYQGNIVTQ